MRLRIEDGNRLVASVAECLTQFWSQGGHTLIIA